MKKNTKKIVLAVSGGIDSAVSVKLLKDQGYEVLGVFMRLFNASQDSEMAARQICKKFNVKFYPLNLSQKFQKQVKDYFLKAYASGITPNPCVRCNKFIKFGELLRIKKELQADFLATGHYVRSTKLKVESEKYLYKLFRGIDESKDQSYFLYNLTQGQLKQIIFPLGEMTKKEVKKIAQENNIPSLKKESQDVCFLYNKGKIIPHNEYLKGKIKLIPGKIKTLDNEVVGKHQGLPLYTIGQRRGVEIGGTGPYYVAKLDYQTNTLYVVNDADEPSLFRKEFFVEKLNWISGEKLKLPVACEVVIRYRHKQVPCEIFNVEDKQYLVKLKSPERAVCPGQSAVFYQKNELLGGAIIA